jgi:hypothetical protein
MWQLNNKTPFAAERDWVRDRQGAEVWVVAVKCTFDVGTDGALPVTRVPVYHGAPGHSSLAYDTDLPLTKLATDITVLGHAHAPGGRPVRELDAGFRVGPVSKLVRVFGERVWNSTGPSEPEPFQRLPMIFEHAFGGGLERNGEPGPDTDWRNPVGRGVVPSSHRSPERLPNIERPDQLLSRPADRPLPAGLGPLPAHWLPRRALAGTYDDGWRRDRLPLLPTDFDDRFHQSAPIDQQAPGFLVGGESVTLVHLNAQARIDFVLPRISLGFETRFYDGSREIHKVRKLHSVILEPDAPRVSLVWHSALPCHFKVQKLKETLITVKERRSLSMISSDTEVEMGDGDG